MNKRTNTAQWEEKYQRWRIAVQKDGVRKQFYSSTPGRTGQREANAKADAWLENDIAVKAGRVENVYQLWIDDLKLTTSTGNWKPVESRWRTWVLPIIGKKKPSSTRPLPPGRAVKLCSLLPAISGHSANTAAKQSSPPSCRRMYRYPPAPVIRARACCSLPIW